MTDYYTSSSLNDNTRLEIFLANVGRLTNINELPVNYKFKLVIVR